MTTKKTPRPIEYDGTLTALSRDIDAVLGRAAGFREAIQDYRKGNDMISSVAATTEYYKDVHMAAAIAVGSKSRIYHGNKVIDPQHVAGSTTMHLKSETVKKAHPELWEAARVSEPRFHVKGICDRPLARLPRVAASSLELSEALWEIKERRRHGKVRVERAKETLAVLRVELAQALPMPAHMVKEFGPFWTGTPKVRTTCGWEIGWFDLSVYREATALEVAREWRLDVDRMLTPKVNPSRTWYRIRENVMAAGDVDEDGDIVAD